ncbi:MAG: RluA family pseudouridine synthase [Clostridia bacterium]|nr:RluA family pseudouridine synthase [Clostridia bacterium]
MQEILIESSQAGQRMDKLLLKYLNKAGSGFIYKMLRKKNILLNDKKASGSEMLVAGDQIKLYLSDETINKFREDCDPVVLSKLKIPPIVYEDQNILLFDKPKNLLTQKTKEQDISLNEYLIQYLQETNASFFEEYRFFHPSVCNRLDRNTSGIVLCAKTLLGAQTLSELLKSRNLHKYYLCIVEGVVNDCASIDGYLKKDEKTNKVSVLKSSQVSSKEASAYSYIKTSYRPVKVYDNQFTLLEVLLITGKSHQIRAHLSSIGHPIIGDYKYGKKNVNQTYMELYGVKSQLLHAYRVVFPKLAGELSDLSFKEFKTEIPKEFKKIMEEELS